MTRKYKKNIMPLFTIIISIVGLLASIIALIIKIFSSEHDYILWIILIMSNTTILISNIIIIKNRKNENIER